MDRSACGSCGSKSGCGCSAPNPYAQSFQNVWHDPTQYEVQKHGPRYLSAGQKSEVRQWVRQASTPDIAVPAAYTALGRTVCFMRALAFVHQTHHWQTSGKTSYEDHKLFERIYDESLPLIDAVGERAVGTDGAQSVDPLLQASGISLMVAAICGHLKSDSALSSLESASPDLLIARSLRGETMFQKVVAAALKDVSPGTSNLLEGVADTHETFIYLLTQRSGGHVLNQSDGYDYNRL